MKTLLLGLCLSFIAESDGKSILQNTYSIVSDVESASVKAGTCKITGNASFGGDAIAGAIISTLDRTRVAKTDSLGNYELVVSAKDTSLFFFKEQHDEIVIWNYKFQSKHHVVINFYGGWNSSMLEVDKPVIYLYSKEKKEVDLSLSFKGDLTFTYPEINEGWKVTVDNNELIDNETGKKHPYLFWEGTSEKINYSSEIGIIAGQVVAKEQIVTYLEESLSKMGLNSTESTDFITFWGPRMVKNNFVFIQFIIDEDYTSKIAELNVSPTPEAMRRVYMLFSGFEEYPNHISIKNQDLPGFERKDYSLIEWGGSEVPATSYDL